jgi:hypothetical protein
LAGLYAHTPSGLRLGPVSAAIPNADGSFSKDFTSALLLFSKILSGQFLQRFDDWQK